MEDIFFIAFILYIIFYIALLMLAIYNLIKTIILQEELNLQKEPKTNLYNLYDKENNCLVHDPPRMDYWEIITQISTHQNISVTEAVKRYRELSGIPSNDNLETVSIKRID